MVKRKKRLERGIESIEEQIELHEEKRRLAKEMGEIELEDYYGREIEALKNTKKRKAGQLEKI